MESKGKPINNFQIILTVNKLKTFVDNSITQPEGDNSNGGSE